MTADFLIIGGGVIGLNLALQAARRHPGARIVLLEKEASCGEHASGRNSGVVHAGFYYADNSLKAKFAVEGNRLLKAYASDRGLPLRRCGKLVVAQDVDELASLDELMRRAERNGVQLVALTAHEAREIEPRVRTFERALYSPTTAAIDPRAVIAALVADAEAAGVAVITGSAYLERAGDAVRTTSGTMNAGYVINAAGLHADRIARDFGFSEHHRILPFKGFYLESTAPVGWLRTHVYPVPDFNYPFLGVHYTVTAHGGVKIGPTALPGLWREQYRRLDNFHLAEAREITALQTRLLLSNAFQFRRLAWQETRKRFRRHLLRRALVMAPPPVDSSWRRGRVGIRAQLVDTRSWELEMDFRFEGDERSFHVLNAVSPAFTCAIPFTAYLFDEIDYRLSSSPEKPTTVPEKSGDRGVDVSRRARARAGGLGRDIKGCPAEAADALSRAMKGPHER